MRKKLIQLALVATTSFGLTARAALNLQWNASGWFVQTNHFTALLGDDNSGTSVAQLIFSPDAERGVPHLNGASIDLHSAPDDVVLYSMPLNAATTVDGLGYAQFGFLATNATFVLPGGASTGVVWIRVLDVGNQVSNFIPCSLYIDSPRFTIGAGPAFAVNLNNNPAGSPPPVTDSIEGFPVPGTHDISSKYGLDPGSLLVYAIDDGVGNQEHWGGVLPCGPGTPSGGDMRSLALAGDLPKLTFSGTPGASYVLQAATNLVPTPVTWIDLLTNVAPLNGIITNSDPTAPTPLRFYRTVVR